MVTAYFRILAQHFYNSKGKFWKDSPEKWVPNVNAVCITLNRPCCSVFILQVNEGYYEINLWVTQETVQIISLLWVVSCCKASCIMSVKTYYTDERWSGQNKTYVQLHLEKVWWWHSAPVEQDTEWETFHQPWSQHLLAAPALGHLVPMHILPATANIIFSVWDKWWTPLPTNYLHRQEPSLRSPDIQLVEKLTAPSRIKGSLIHSNLFAIGPCSESDKSSPHPPTLLI